MDTLPSSNSESSNRRTLFRGSPIVGAIFILIGAFFLYYMGLRLPQLACTRIQGKQVNCTLRTTLLGILTLNQQEVDAVQTAQVGQLCSKGNCTYRVELAAAGAITPLTAAYTSDYSEESDLVTRLTDFLHENGRTNFSVTQSPNLLGILVPLVFIAAGIYVSLVPIRAVHHYH
jgi:hypothetical protein